MKLFDSIRIRKPRLNKFDLSHERKLSFNMGKLVPIMCQEIVPGDNFRVSSEIFIRLVPMLAPMMHRVNVYTHYFFVPNRLVWDEWETFITGGVDGMALPVAPYMDVTDSAKARWDFGSLGDYLGVPVASQVSAITNPLKVSALPFRAYQLIYDQYYRDQTLCASLGLSTASGQVVEGPEYTKLTELRNRAWEKDYFTSALPWAQRGGSVLMPIDPQVNYRPTSEVRLTASGNLAATTQPLSTDETMQGGFGVGTAPNIAPAFLDNIESITNASTTINELRKAVRLQEWLEKNARAGSRYIEQILAHFGVRSSDARLQRPEYLGGGKAPVVVSEVLSTFDNVAGGLPQGTMTGRGVSVGDTNGFKRGFEEHGFVIGIMSVLPRTAYQQGLPRQFSRFDKFDYYWPEFANIGEQEVASREIFWDYNVPADPGGTFGYQSRYAEYKYGCSTVHGDFRGNLDYWHQGRIFASQPVLNEAFVMSDPTTRIFAVDDPDADHLYCQIYNNVSALRPMPYFGTPTL